MVDDGIDVWSPAGLLDPTSAAEVHRSHAALRSAGRVLRTETAVLVHRYDDCETVLRHPRTSADVRNVRGPSGHLPRQRHVLLNLDPPHHTRIRRVVSAAFGVRSIQRLRPRMQDHVQRLLDDLAQRGSGGQPVDLVAHFARHLPFEVITDLLGMPTTSSDEMKSWTHALTYFLEPATTVDQRRRAARASVELGAYLREAITWKRSHPADDVLTRLIVAATDELSLTPAELVEQVRLFYVAGHQTVVNQIANGMLALLQDRDQFRRLATDPTMSAPAVEELLRYDSPVQLTRRVALTSFDVGGEAVRPGDLLVTLLGVANHDPDRWGPSADRLDIGRQQARDHLSFGSGIHHCLGAALARAQASEAIPALVRRFPGMQPDDGVVGNGRTVLRGLDELPVTLDAATAPWH